MKTEYLNNKTFEAIIEAFQSFKKRKSRCELVIQDLQETHERRTQRYNDDMKQEAVVVQTDLYRQVCTDFDAYKERLAYAFLILSANLANYTRYAGIEVEDATQEGVTICFEKIDKFDKRKGKAFNYMTTCIINHFRQMYRTNKNYHELKKRYLTFLQHKFERVFLRGGRDRLSHKYIFDFQDNRTGD